MVLSVHHTRDHSSPSPETDLDIKTHFESYDRVVIVVSGELNFVVRSLGVDPELDRQLPISD